MYLYSITIDIFSNLDYIDGKRGLFMIYDNNKQLVTELKKLLLDTEYTQRNIAKQLGISPQALQNMLNKKQLSFTDLKRVLDCINYDLLVDFSAKRTNNVSAGDNTGEQNRLYQSLTPGTTIFKTLTKDSEKQIDLKRLLTDVRYQVEVATKFGENNFKMLYEKAERQQEQ